MKKKLPTLTSDKAALAFLAEEDLSNYDLSAMRTIDFEFSPKEARVNMRMPNDLLAAIKDAAKEAGVPYQRFMRMVLEQAVSR